MSGFYVKAWNADTGDVKWLGPFLTAHMAGCVAMGLDCGVSMARVYTAAEAAEEAA